MLTPNITLENETILVTGAAGFIGAALTQAVLRTVCPVRVIGVDNMNDYYDVSLKEYRLRQIEEEAAKHPESEWIFIRGGIEDADFVASVFALYHPGIVVNLAAQAGVRYSITHPNSYITSNIVGFYNILEACRHSYDGTKEKGQPAGKGQLEEKGESAKESQSAEGPAAENEQTDETGHACEAGYTGVRHLVYASSSSVYGSNTKIPYSTDDPVDHPVSLYAATKKSDELLASAYSQLYAIPCTGLRFFTVYGPAGRPDMAYYSFTDKLCAGKKIQIYNYGNCQRDFTYVDDVVEGVIRVMRHAPDTGPATGPAIGISDTGQTSLNALPDGQASVDRPPAPHTVYNIGNHHPENLMDFVRILTEELVRAAVLPEDFDWRAHIELVPMQPGDVAVTYADVGPLERDFGFRPSTPLRDGLRKFAVWYAASHPKVSQAV